MNQYKRRKLPTDPFRVGDALMNMVAIHILAQFAHGGAWFPYLCANGVILMKVHEMYGGDE